MPVKSTAEYGIGIPRAHTFEDTDSGGVIVDSSCGSQSGSNDGGGGDKIVGEGVVQVALQKVISMRIAIRIEQVG